MRKFKIGDIVQVKEDCPLEELQGLIGKVIVLDHRDNSRRDYQASEFWNKGGNVHIGVEFDINILDKYDIVGHNCQIGKIEYGKWGHCRWFGSWELQPIETENDFEIKWWKNGKLVKENNSNRDFKIGDRVVACGNYDGKFLIGKQGTIDYISKTGDMTIIEFDDYINGHTGHFGKDGYCWTIPTEYVELTDYDNDNDDIKWWKDGKLVKENNINKKFEIGDRVVVLKSQYKNLIGLEGTVITIKNLISGEARLGVEFDIDISNYFGIEEEDCGGSGKLGYCRTFMSKLLKLVEQDNGADIKWWVDGKLS